MQCWIGFECWWQCWIVGFDGQYGVVVQCFEVGVCVVVCDFFYFLVGEKVLVGGEVVDIVCDLFDF